MVIFGLNDKTTMKSIFANYPDIINGALIPMIIAVFAIALPP